MRQTDQDNISYLGSFRAISDHFYPLFPDLWENFRRPRIPFSIYLRLGWFRWARSMTAYFFPIYKAWRTRPPTNGSKKDRRVKEENLNVDTREKRGQRDCISVNTKICRFLPSIQLLTGKKKNNKCLMYFGDVRRLTRILSNGKRNEWRCSSHQLKCVETDVIDGIDCDKMIKRTRKDTDSRTEPRAGQNLFPTRCSTCSNDHYLCKSPLREKKIVPPCKQRLFSYACNF